MAPETHPADEVIRRRRMTALVAALAAAGLLCVLWVWFRRETPALKPLRPYLDQLISHGWKIREDVRHSPYRAVNLFRSRQDAGPYNRLLLSVQQQGRESVLMEWGEIHYPFLGTCGFSETLVAGRPVFFFGRGTGGNGWTCSEVRTFALDPGGPRDVSPKLPQTWVVHSVEDVDGAGADELMVLICDYEFYAGLGHAGSPSAFRIYRWDQLEERFVDKSAVFRDYYEKRIATLRKEIEVSLESEDPAKPDMGWRGPAISMLLNYCCMGRTEEGWQEFSGYVERGRKSSRKNVVPNSPRWKRTCKRAWG